MFTVRGNYFRFILSTHAVHSARHMLKKDSLCFVCITAHTIAAPVSPLSLLLRHCVLCACAAVDGGGTTEGGRRPLRTGRRVRSGFCSSFRLARAFRLGYSSWLKSDISIGALGIAWPPGNGSYPRRLKIPPSQERGYHLLF